MVEAFPIPRVVRSKVYRSKAASPTQSVSSSVFSTLDLRGSVSDTTFELRGNTGNGYPAAAGLLALSLLGGRVIR